MSRLLATTQAVVRACEQADALHLSRQIAALASTWPQARALAIPVAGGTAALTLPEFGRKLNHVVGAWLGEPVQSEQLHELERRYAERSITLEIDLCPHSAAENLARLADADYRVNAYTNVYWQDLRESEAVRGSAPANVRELLPTEHERFVTASVEGFAAQPKPRSRALLEALARAALARDDTLVYVAEHDGKWIATAGLALLPTELGPVAHLYLASTLPAHRRTGAQAQLLRHRLQAAQARGAALASVTTRLATSSARNVERAGLRLGYTRPTFARHDRRR